MRKLKYILMLSLCFINISCESEKTSEKSVIINAFPNLTFENPVDIQTPEDETDRIFIVSQKGKIFVFPNDMNVNSADLFLDISEKVLFGGEQGLLGLTFHPDFKSNGKFFVDYVADNPRRTVVSSFTVSKDLNTAIHESEEIILEVEQPFSNHNGGQIAFGPDGYLYISLGDGGSGGDPGNRAQDLKSYLGKILRIDVNKNENGKLYGIPFDNTFKGNTQGYLEEIYAYGLRNVWRFSFDGKHNLWAADVGQNAWEEINIIQKGGNYGWRIMEGYHCYNPSSDCDTTGLILPIWEYGHNESGGYSITGGYVYERNDIIELTSKYIYADFVSGNIWSYDLSSTQNKLITKINGQISTFGTDGNQNLFFADYQNGTIHKFVGENVSSIENEINPEFVLYQNYPNPFNPTTTIKYSIHSVNEYNSNFVQLVIFDVLGRKVKTLVNKIQNPGNYEINLDASLLQSGIYFYKLTVGSFSKSNKMLLLN